MLSSWLLGVGFSAVLAAAPAPELAEYEAAKASAGRDSQAQVKLALWCEAHGLSAERIKHLALAVLSDPKNVTARGLLGLVEFRDRWERPESISKKVRADEDLTARLAEYNARRARAGRSADDHWRLALWCEEVGLEAEAKAHLATVTRIDPSREAAWKKLGFKKAGQRWVTDEQLAAEKAEAEAQKKADQRWKPLLTKWRGWLRDKDKGHRDRAEKLLATVTDPRAVPMINAVFSMGDAADQDVAVRLLGQIDAGGSSRALAMLAAFGKTAETRRAAAETLRRRDPRDFLGLLIALVRKPLKYEVRSPSRPGAVGELFVEGERYNVQRSYGANPQQLQDLNRLERMFQRDAMRLMPGTTKTGRQEVQLLAYVQIEVAEDLAARQAIAAASQQQLANDVKGIEAYNANVEQANNQILPTLSGITGMSLSADPQAWEQWWTDQQGYVYAPTTKPTFTDFVSSDVTVPTPPHHACFAAGTPVRTRDGYRPIESIQVGDQVLSQDPTTGRLSFVPVLAAFHNKPAATLRIRIGDEDVVATGIHRFWKAGHGWAMARELKAGDVLRTVGGTARVGSVETESVQPVFNLEVGPNQSYFVGQAGALVHDNSLVLPVAHPFDAEPSLAALAR